MKQLINRQSIVLNPWVQGDRIKTVQSIKYSFTKFLLIKPQHVAKKKGLWRLQSERDTLKDEDTGKQSNKFSENSYSKQQIKLNPNQSLITHIMRLNRIDSFCDFYEKQKSIYNARILALSSRFLCTIIQKQKRHLNDRTRLKLQKFLSDVLQISPRLRIEEVQQDQLKNFLFFIKKATQDQAQQYGLVRNSQNYNEALQIKTKNFKNELINRFMDQQFNFKYYQVNQLIEVFFHLIRFSSQNESEKLYSQLLRFQKKIEQNVNPQFMFSTTNILLTIRTIEQSQMKDSRENQDSNIIQQNIRQSYQMLGIKQKQQMPVKLKNQNILLLRRQCYQIFFKKWMYYFQDMKLFIKLHEVTGIWPVIVLSQSGPIMLLNPKYGGRALQLIHSILVQHNVQFQELTKNYFRISSNTIVIFYLLSKQHPSNEVIAGLLQKAQRKLALEQSIQKAKVKIRMRSFVQMLKQQKAISEEQQTGSINFINAL